MASTPTYKWWETDDKTKRVYTEVLVEKLTKASPKKTEKSPIKEKLHHGDNMKEQLCPPRLTAPPNSPTKVTSQDGSHLEKSSSLPDRKGKKYQFETITMETLAKYDYIKSPKKQRNLASNKNDMTKSTLTVDSSKEKTLIDQEWEKKLATSNSRTNTGKNQKSYYDDQAHSPRTPRKTLKLSDSYSPNKYNKHEAMKSSVECNGKAERSPFSSSKPNLTRSKLEEIPEDDSSDVQEMSTEDSDGSSDSATSHRGRFKHNLESTRKEETHTKTQEPRKSTSSKNDVDLSFLRGEELLKTLSDKYVSLTEKVELLEFRLLEYTDDIYKLKHAVGIKTKEDEDEKLKDEKSSPNHKVQLGSPRHGRPNFKHSISFAASKDMLTNKYAAKSLMLKQQLSPLKAGKSPSRAMTLASVKENISTLRVDPSNNKSTEEKDLTEDEIQEILRSAKAKYIDKSNYLEELGYSIREND